MSQISHLKSNQMTFEEFFAKKRIDLAALGKAEPMLLSEFKTHFEQMGEKSFDHTKKYWFNKLRLIYHLAPEPKAEKVVIENPLAEQTITESLVESFTPAPKAGFKPRFNAGMAKLAAQAPEKPAEATEPQTPAAPKVGFTPRFKAGVTKSAEPGETTPAQEPKESTEQKPAAPPTKVGFTPRFKAGVTKPAEPEESDLKETTKSTEVTPPATPAKVGFTPRFKAGVTKTAAPAPEPKDEPPTAEKSTESNEPKQLI